MTAPLFDQLKTALEGTYTLERELGGGGMSRVFVATDPTLGRRIVVKALPPDVSVELSVERFRREIRVTANLQHPHIVPVFTAGSAGGLLYYTMPYVQGRSLRARLDETEPLTTDEIESIARDVLQALAYAHRKGIIHRDIKPGNILLTEDGALVTDFGIARATQSAAAPSTPTDARFELTQTGTSIGTLRYMAPEQVLADPAADHRMDLYAFGLVLHECLTGSLPFQGLPELRWREAMLTKSVPRITEWRPQTPRLLAELVDRCLARDPDHRPASAEEALKMLGASGPAPASVSSRARKRRAIAGGTTVALLAFGGWVVKGPLKTPLATAVRIASRPDAALGTNRIIVAPFDATPDEPSLRTLGAMVADQVAQGLSLLTNVEVVDARAVLINAEVVDRIPRVLRGGDRDVALARESGAGVVITGHLYRVGDSVRANAAVVDAGTGRIRQTLGDFVVPAGATQQLVDRIRRRAAAAVAQASDSTLRVDFGVLSPPPSVEAYALMRRGLRQVLERDTSAIETLRRASASDRTWIMPRLLLITAAQNAGRFQLADSAMAQVRALIEHASPVERALLEVHEANFRLDRRAAFAAAENLSRLSPGSGEVQLLAAAQALLAEQPRRAIEITSTMDPDRGVNLGSTFYWRYRAIAYEQLGQFERALETASEGQRRFEASDLGRQVVQSLAALHRGEELADAIERYAASGRDRPERRALLAQECALWLIRVGDSTRARTLAIRALSDEELERRAADTSRAAMLRRLGLASVVRDTATVVQSLRQLTARRSPIPREDVWLRGLLAAARRDTIEAARADSILARQADRYDFGWTPYRRASIAALAEDRDSAIRLLTEARDRGYPFNNTEGFRPDLDPFFVGLHGYAPFERLVAPRTGGR